jgi:hypothetical protein
LTLSPSCASTNAPPPEMQEITTRVQKSTQIPSEQNIESRKDEAWDGRTLGVQLCTCTNYPTFNNKPSIFAEVCKMVGVCTNIKTSNNSRKS